MLKFTPAALLAIDRAIVRQPLNRVLRLERLPNREIRFAWSEFVATDHVMELPGGVTLSIERPLAEELDGWMLDIDGSGKLSLLHNHDRPNSAMTW